MPFRRRWPLFQAAALALLAAACDDLPSDPAPPITVATAAPELALSGSCVIVSINRTYSSDGFSQLNDFGRILADADNPGCAANAATYLRDKLINTRVNDGDWFGDEWIDGNYVAMVLAAADRIGQHGHMTESLDAELQYVANTFRHVPEPLNGCGLDQTDNCLDGYSAAAAGWAWIANYRYRHNDGGGASTARTKAQAYIDSSFASVCLRQANLVTGPLCQNGPVTPAMIRTGEAVTWGWNIGHQFPGYGFGLVTSIAAAVLGYEGSLNGGTYSFSQPHKDVAVGLFEETRRVVDASTTPDSWPSCMVPQGSGSTWTFGTARTHCGGPEPRYEPEMYALRTFYGARMGYTPPSTGYQSSYLNTAHFDTTAANRSGWFGYGRYVFYGDLGYRWWTTRRGYQPLDSYQAKGWLERIDGGRVAHGWACDQDAPTKSVRVELRVMGYVVTGLANQPSDGAIYNECGGGYAHRFSIQLPSVPVGSAVYARALDYTYGYTDLACVPGGSCVVPQAATVSVVWVQPAENSWGPPNTLTAAGHANGGSGGVTLQWRDVTFNPGAAWKTEPYVAPVDANGNWSNTIPTPYDCHTIEVKATYSGVTTPVFTYYGRTAGFCTETARMIWIQPSSTAGFGPPGSLVVAGEALNAPAGTTVAMYYRNLTLGQVTFTRKNYDAPTDANGIWLNDIPNADPYHRYEVYAVYDVITTNRCTYQGTNSNTWC